MLIVVTIMMILVAAAATTLRPANDSRRTREAARAIDLYLASARNRAMETGRPCGVMLRRFNGTASVMTMDQCDVPLCYCGETEQSTATVTYGGSGNTVNARLDLTIPPGMVREHDLIQFNGQGPLYSITNPPDYPAGRPEFVTTSRLSLTFDASQGQLVPWQATPVAAVSYRIFRAPVKNAATTLQLPATTVIDMTASGIDPMPVGSPFPDKRFSDADGDVVIMFSPSGSVQCVYAPTPSGMPGVIGIYPVVEPIFLLIGKQERMQFVAASYDPNNPDTFANYQDLNNLWVMINPQTGLVTTGEVAAIPAWNNITNYVVGDFVCVGLDCYRCIANNNNKPPATNQSVWAPTAGAAAARAIARDAQGMGGK